MVEVVILGVLGRMGRMILSSAETNPNLIVIGGVVKSPKDLEQNLLFRNKTLSLTCDLQQLLSPGVVVIDFTSVATTLTILSLIKDSKSKLVIGTTGFSKSEKQFIYKTSEFVPVVFSPNMSIGVNVLFAVVEQVARTLDIAYDVEITETHHTKKQDSPSGTAMGLLDSVTKGHDSSLDKACYGRQGFYKERPKGEIGMHALRAGDIIGDHSVLFAGKAERLEFKHVAHDRSVFADGSCTAALFLNKKEHGLFSMLDVLNIKVG